MLADKYFLLPVTVQTALNQRGCFLFAENTDEIKRLFIFIRQVYRESDKVRIIIYLTYIIIVQLHH